MISNTLTALSCLVGACGCCPGEFDEITELYLCQDKTHLLPLSPNRMCQSWTGRQRCGCQTPSESAATKTWSPSRYLLEKHPSNHRALRILSGLQGNHKDKHKSLLQHLTRVSRTSVHLKSNIIHPLGKTSHTKLQ